MPDFGSLSMGQDSFTIQSGSIGESVGRAPAVSGNGSKGTKEGLNRGVLRRPFNFGSLDEDP